VAALRARIASGGEADAPRLLSYYVNTPTSRLGHTVLLFGAGGGLAALDPERSEKPVVIPASLGADPRSVARYLRGGFVSAARVLPIGAVGRTQPPGRWVALPSPGAPAG